MTTKANKWVIGILGTILLGALGSGLWDLILRDFFAWIGRFVLTGLTLGFTSIREGFYAEIAQGRNDRVILNLLGGTVLLLSGALGFCLGFRHGAADAEREMHDLEGLRISDPSAFEKDAERLIPKWDRQTRKSQWIEIMLLIFTVSIIGFRALVLTYECNAVNHFEQVYAICLPFLGQPERDRLRFDFARIKTKTDYLSVMNQLQAVAGAQSIRLPDFPVW